MAKQEMANRKYLLGLLLIITLVWLTMILCLVVIYTLLPSVGVLTVSGLAIAILKLLMGGAILLAWLYLWNMLVKSYFNRNLNSTEPKNLSSRKQKK